MADPDEPLWGGDSPAIPGVDHPDSNISIELDPHTDLGVPGAEAPHSYYVFDIPAGTDPITVIAWNDSNDNPGISGFMFDTGDDPWAVLDDGSLLDEAARKTYVHDTLGTWIGDSNKDGEFNSSDLVFVLEAGEYEDATDGNSTWVEGDWTGDGDFNSSDLVYALGDGGYEAGPRAATAAVPEPSSIVLLLVGALALVRRRR